MPTPGPVSLRDMERELNTDNLNGWLFGIAMPEYRAWLGGLVSEAGQHPLLAALLVLACIFTTILGRSPWVFASTIVFCLLFLALHSETESMVVRQALSVLAVAGLSVLALGVFLLRRRVVIEQRHRSSVEAEKKALQKLLDQEITWRRAAEKADVHHP